LAGGTFDLNVSKIRPGDYINYKSKRTQSPNGSTRGSVIIPLIGLGWGPDKTAVKLTAAAPDASMAQLGHSVYDNNDFMLMIREAFKNATTVTAYVLNHGTAATGTGGGITITATYGGTRGNDIAVASIADTDGTFTVRVYLDTDKVEEYTEISTIQSLIDASSGKYVKFSATDTSAAVTAFASVNLTGGTDGTVSNGDITAFLDASETIRWNTMCFPVTESTLQTAAITKVQYFRDSVGKYVQIVMPNCQADYEGVINVTNSVTVDDKDLTVAQACAWVAGATAAATKLTSLTQVPYVGASAVVSVKDNETAKAAIKVGEFFFSTTVDDTGNEIVVVEYDINSLHTFTKEKTKDYAKNRVIRVYDTFGEDLKLTFPSNKFDNEDDGWLVMEGLGRSLLQSYDDDGSIRNVDLDADFYVDQSRSVGDETYFNIGLQAVDSSEKLYFSVSTR
jgi:hypothetical protein